jgi:hypothetical protein
LTGIQIHSNVRISRQAPRPGGKPGRTVSISGKPSINAQDDTVQNVSQLRSRSDGLTAKHRRFWTLTPSTDNAGSCVATLLVTRPTDRIVQQLREAFPEAGADRYAIFARDSKFDADVVAFLQATGLEPKQTRAPSETLDRKLLPGDLERVILTMGAVRSLEFRIPIPWRPPKQR